MTVRSGRRVLLAVLAGRRQRRAQCLATLGPSIGRVEVGPVVAGIECLVFGPRQGRAIARQARGTSPPPTREDPVVWHSIIAPADEDGLASSTDLLTVADLDEGQGAREVDGSAKIDGQPGRAQGSPEADRLAEQTMAVDLPAIGATTMAGCWAGSMTRRLGSGRGLGQVAARGVTLDASDVLLVLEDDAEALVDDLG